MKFDWSKINFSDAFLQPAVLKIWGFVIIAGLALLIFRVLLKRGATTYFRNHPSKRAKTSTLILAGIFLVTLFVIVWKAFLSK